jgi:hypothetical protein
MLYIVAATAVVYVLNTAGVDVYKWLAFDPELVLQGQVWRLISWVTLNLGYSILWFAIAMYFFYTLGSALEKYWGSAKFSVFYLSGMLLCVIYSTVIWFVFGIKVDSTSYYLNMSLFFAFASIAPNIEFLMFFFIPVKAIWLVLLDAAYFIYAMISMLRVGMYADAFLPLVSVLNFLLLCNIPKVKLNLRGAKKQASRPEPMSYGYRNKYTPADADFQEKTTPYVNRCVVCGRSDITNPELMFRYKYVEGNYKCYCDVHMPKA